MTLEIFEKRYKCNDYDGTLVESIKLQTSSSSQHHNHPSQQSHNMQRPLLNDKNHSIIDKQIANLIHSNELKTLGSPPHSSLKRVSPLDTDKKAFLISKLSTKTQYTNEHNRQKLEKKRLKKQHMQQQQFKLDQAKKLLNLSANSTGSSATMSPLAALNTSVQPRVLQTKLKTNKLNKSFNSSSQIKYTKDYLAESTNLNMKNQVMTTAPSTCSSVSYQSSLVSSTDAPSVSNKTDIVDEVINYEQIVNEALNSLSTNIEKDGYWCFKRKEGCKYLPQSKLNDSDEFDGDSTRAKYGYMITKNSKHLGLLRRRVGRGGRIVLDRYDNQMMRMHRLNWTKMLVVFLNCFLFEKN